MSQGPLRSGDPAPDAPEGARIGPLPVGVRTLFATDPDRLDVLRLDAEDDPRASRTLTLEVWYPARATSGAPAIYGDVLGAEGGKQPFRFAGRAMRDAEVAQSSTSFPLVVVSHGYPGSRVFMTWLTEHLASHGFIVVAPDFADSTHADFGARSSTLLNRPLDILFVIRHLAALAADAGHWLGGRLDVERTGLVGYSMGGYGSLNAAGAGFKAPFVDWPASVPKRKLAVRATGHPSFDASADPRIRCVAAIAPWGAHDAWDPADFSALRVPLLFLVGDADDVAGYDPGVAELFEWAVRVERHLVVFQGASHALGANPPPPEAAESRSDWQHYAEPVWDKGRLHDAMRHFLLRFLGAHLRADAATLPKPPDTADGRLAPNVAFDGFTPGASAGFEMYARAGRALATGLTPTLPAADPDPAGRHTAIAAERLLWRYNYSANPPLAMAEAVPDFDQFPPAWLAANVRVLGELVQNAVKAVRALDPSRPIDDRELAKIVALADAAVAGVENPWTLLPALQNALETLRLSGDATGLTDFRALFQSIRTPTIAQTFLNDAAFAENFIAGANPLILEQREHVDHPAFRALLAAALPDGAPLEERTVLAADYSGLAGVECGQHGPRQKYLPAPLACFVVRDGRLVPFAIRLGANPQDAWVGPKDNAVWRVAMTAVRVADANMSALWFHHARTHMIIEPLVLATRRNLSARHPVRILLEPHFAGTLAINRAGQVTVFAEGGAIEKVGAATRPAFRRLAVQAVQTQGLRDLEPRRALAARGLLDKSVLPDFPFREDSLAVWDAIAAWVSANLSLYYLDNEDVAGDSELQAFVSELGALDGGRLTGVGAVDTLADLAEVVAITIYTASALHWALNGPLRTLMTFVPNYPLAAYAEPGTHVTDADLLAMMPPLDQAQRQFEAAYGMGSTRYGQLGVYPEGHFSDVRVGLELARFQAELAQVEAAIVARNALRDQPYEMLLPSQIPASINI